MQIHELNSFTGTLGENSFLAVDNGTDTGKVSTQQLLANTEARIDNIIAGDAPSAAEVTDARYGADGVTYTSLGTAIRTQVSDLKADITQLYDTTFINEWDGVTVELTHEYSLSGGAFVDRDNVARAATRPFYKSFSKIKVEVLTNYYVEFDFYSAPNEASYINNTGWITSDREITPSGDYFRIVVGGASDISSVMDDIATISVQSKIYEVIQDLQDKCDSFVSTPTIVNDKYVKWSDGTLNSYNGLKVYEYNLVKGMYFDYSYTYPSPDHRGLAFYDSNDDYISGVQTQTTSQRVTVPNNAVKARITATSESQIEIAYNFNDAIAELNKSTEFFKDYLIASFGKIGVAGDSLASGEVYYNSSGSVAYVDDYDKSWIQFIARKYGISAINFSKGGLSTATWLTDSEGLTKLQTTGNECEMYFIGLGANDITAMQGGTMTVDQYESNYRSIISAIKAVQPKAKIFILTLPYPYSTVSATSVYALPMNEKIRTIASDTSNCYCLDLANDSWFVAHRDILVNNTRNYHYNAIAYNMMGMHLADLVNEYMYKNQSEFAQVEFIGTDKSWTD